MASYMSSPGLLGCELNVFNPSINNIAFLRSGFAITIDENKSEAERQVEALENISDFQMKESLDKKVLCVPLKQAIYPPKSVHPWMYEEGSTSPTMLLQIKTATPSKKQTYKASKQDVDHNVSKICVFGFYVLSHNFGK